MYASENMSAPTIPALNKISHQYPNGLPNHKSPVGSYDITAEYPSMVHHPAGSYDITEYPSMVHHHPAGSEQQQFHTPLALNPTSESSSHQNQIYGSGVQPLPEQEQFIIGPAVLHDTPFIDAAGSGSSTYSLQQQQQLMSHDGSAGVQQHLQEFTESSSLYSADMHLQDLVYPPAGLQNSSAAGGHHVQPNIAEFMTAGCYHEFSPESLGGYSLLPPQSNEIHGSAGHVQQNYPPDFTAQQLHSYHVSAAGENFNSQLLDAFNPAAAGYNSLQQQQQGAQQLYGSAGHVQDQGLFSGGQVHVAAALNPGASYAVHQEGAAGIQQPHGSCYPVTSDSSSHDYSLLHPDLITSSTVQQQHENFTTTQLLHEYTSGMQYHPIIPTSESYSQQPPPEIWYAPSLQQQPDMTYLQVMPPHNNYRQVATADHKPPAVIYQVTQLPPLHQQPPPPPENANPGPPQMVVCPEPSIFPMTRPRLRWTAELHHRFVRAVLELGGLYKATPRTIIKKMNITGLSMDNVKSHLQKLRIKHPNDIIGIEIHQHNADIPVVPLPEGGEPFEAGMPPGLNNDDHEIDAQNLIDAAAEAPNYYQNLFNAADDVEFNLQQD